MELHREGEAKRRANPDMYPEMYRKIDTQQGRTLHDGSKPYDVGIITRILLRTSGPMLDVRVMYR
jgi:hypothetical protein